MQRFWNILVVCNGDESDRRNLDRIADLADRNRAKVTLFRVVGTSTTELAQFFNLLPGLGGDALADDVMAEHRAHIEALAAQLRDCGMDVELDITSDTDFIEVIRRVLRQSHDLVTKMIVPVDRSSFPPRQDMHLTRKSPCPVWIFNTASDIIPRRILAAIHPDPTHPEQNQLLMQLATSMAAWSDARLDVMSVWRLPEEPMLHHCRIKRPTAEVDALVEQMRPKSAAKLPAPMDGFPEVQDRMRMVNIKGLASDQVVDHVTTDQIGLVIMSTLSRTGVAGLWIGNTAETVLSQVCCSVMAVKPEGFVSPATLDEGVS